jgi:hypothetical protein
MQTLQPFEAAISFSKGDITKASWGGGPISVYVDDAAKRSTAFCHVLKTFGPAWIPGVTVVVLMDYYFWKKNPDDAFKCQTRFIESHREYFEPAERLIASCAAFLYRKPLDFSRLQRQGEQVAISSEPLRQ